MIKPKFKPQVPRRTLEEIQRQGRWRLNARLSYLTYSFRYGLYYRLPPQLRRFLPFIQEDIKDLFRADKDERTTSETFPVSVETEAEIPTEFVELYDKYRCPFNNPLNCQESRSAIAENPEIKSCPKCGFPAPLPNLASIQGKRGRYRIEQFLNSRGRGRIYRGIQLIEERPVLIKEYPLPRRYFNEKEGIEAQITFENVGGLSLADGRLQTGRIVEVLEAIGDRNDRERCYLITTFYDTISLRTHLARKGAMSPRQARHFLGQTLQSLEYLHGQKFRLPNGQIKVNLAHGNLNLDSALISPQEQLYFYDPQFQVYLTDLALWERLFEPPPATRLNATPAQDLKALGYLGFYCLAGGDRDRTGHILDPKFNSDWGRTDIALKLFLFRLLELDAPFASAAEARRALLNLPEDDEQTGAPAPVEPQTPENRRSGPWWRWMLLLLALGLLGGALTGWLLRRQAARANTNIPICCIADVAGVPTGEFTYTGEQKGIWSYVLRQPNLIQKDKSLEAELAEKLPKVQLNYRPQPTGEDAIAEVRSEQVDFAISSLTDNLSSDLGARTFAYDGLTFYVPFSYKQRDRSLPKHLNGKISFRQLQQLYTGKISNWKQLGGPDLPVKLYVPASSEAVRLFEERILQSEEKIGEFRQLIRSQENSITIRPNVPEIVRLPTIPALRGVLQDFENDRIGAIGFGAISQVFGQCSVYPLAVGDRDRNFVQPLIQDSGKPIDPAIDLCSKKGSYTPDYRAFQSGRYPLAYPLAVIFRRDNRRSAIGDRFAEILKTEESQKLLQKTGIVPLSGDR